MKRRTFLQTVGAGVGWGLAGTSLLGADSCNIGPIPVRRDINSLAANDPIINAYKSAVSQMKALDPSNPLSWAAQAEIHNLFCTHHNWLFLPWHRAYLLYFERICRKLSGMADFALPYWNWTKNPTLPAVFWGDASNPLYDSTRTATPTSTALPGFVGATVVDGIMNETNFLIFGSGFLAPDVNPHRAGPEGPLEMTPHDYIHNFVGGNMLTFRSPLDPIFWLHHNMVERLWVKWNFDLNRSNTTDLLWLDRQFTDFYDENGTKTEVTPRVEILYPALSYRYDDVGPGAPAAAPKIAARKETKAMRESFARTARAGATVKLEMAKRFAAAAPLLATLDKPAQTRIVTEATAVRDALAGGLRTLLYLEGVSQNHSGDFTVSVYLNKPDANAATPDTDPHLVRSFAFFHDPTSPHAGMLGAYLFDAQPTLQRLSINGGPLEITIVLVPLPGTPKTRELTVQTAELRFMRSIVTK